MGSGRVRFRSAAVCLVVSGIVSTSLPHAAHAAPASPRSARSDEGGILDVFRDWFSDDAEDDGRSARPRDRRSPTGAGLGAHRPRLVLTAGRPAVEVTAPTTIHATGPELTWSGYDDPSAGDTGDDIVEYQVHRSVHQRFTPSAATLVAPLAPGTTSFTDTTAVPTGTDDPDPVGRAYSYLVGVRTKDGRLIAAPATRVRLPRAGRTVKVLTAADDTTPSSAPSLRFPALGLPARARVLEAKVRPRPPALGERNVTRLAQSWAASSTRRDLVIKDPDATAAPDRTAARDRASTASAPRPPRPQLVVTYIDATTDSPTAHARTPTTATTATPTSRRSPTPTATPRPPTATPPTARTTSPSSPAPTDRTPAVRPRRRTTPTATTPSGGTRLPARTTWASATTTPA